MILRQKGGQMKKIKWAALAFAFLLTLNACGSHQTAVTAEPLESAETTEAASSAHEVTSSETQAAAQQPDPSAEESTEISKNTTSRESSDPIVYFTSDISAEGLIRIYESLGWEPQGEPAVKISTGEPPASNYLRPL